MTETPTPTADVSAEQRESESDAEFVDYFYGTYSTWGYPKPSKADVQRLIALARRATAPAPQRQDGYRAGMLRSGIDPGKPVWTKSGIPISQLTWLPKPHSMWYGEGPDGRPWLWHRSDGRRDDDSLSLTNDRAEAAAPEPPVVIDGTSSSGGAKPVAWAPEQSDGPAVLWLEPKPYWEDERRWSEDPHESDDLDSVKYIRADLVAAPPAPVPAGEVTEIIKKLRSAWASDLADYQYYNGPRLSGEAVVENKIKAADEILAALTAAQPRADAGVTEAWRPIETAPRDGTAVLLIDGDTDCPVVARWVGNCWRVCWDNEIYELSNLGGRGCHWMQITGRAALAAGEVQSPTDKCEHGIPMLYGCSDCGRAP